MRKLVLIIGILLAPQTCISEEYAVKRGELWHEASHLGEFEARQKQSVLAPKASDRYNSLTVVWVASDGTAVTTGDRILEFDMTDVEADIQKASLELLQAEGSANLVSLEQAQALRTLQLAKEKATLQVQRAEVLLLSDEVKVMSKIDVEKSKLDKVSAQMQLDDAVYSLEAFAKRTTAAIELERLKLHGAQERLARLTSYKASLLVTAPRSGIVYRPFTRIHNQLSRVEPGTVAAHGDRLLEILDLSSFDVRIYVRQSESFMIQAGDSAQVFPAASPQKPLKAVVVHKDSFTTARSERLGEHTRAAGLKEVGVLLQLGSGQDWLKPGMTAEVRIRSLIAANPLIIPIKAVDPLKGTVRTSTGQKPVTLGRLGSSFVEVAGGLMEGEIVLLP